MTGEGEMAASHPSHILLSEKAPDVRSLQLPASGEAARQLLRRRGPPVGRLSGHIASRLQPIWLPLAAGTRAQALQASGMGLPSTLAGTCKMPNAPACQVTKQVQML